MLAAHMAHDEIDRDRAEDKGETVPAAFDASKGRMILDEEFLTLLPGEARWCNVKLQDQAGAVMDGQSFVAMDGEDEFAASGLGLAETKALLEPGDGGPQEGRESQRAYVPLELRAIHHSTDQAKHQHSRSMHKQLRGIIGIPWRRTFKNM